MRAWEVGTGWSSRRATVGLWNNTVCAVEKEKEEEKAEEEEEEEEEGDVQPLEEEAVA